MISPQPMDVIGAHPGGIHRFGWCGPAAPGRRWWMIAFSIAVLSVVAVWAAAQDPEVEEEEDVADKAAVVVELMDREPFYQLTLDAEDGNAVIEILPLESVAVDPKPTDRLRVRLVNNPEQEYEVTWEHIAKLRTYNQLVFEEGVRLVQEKKYNAAFRNFDYLLRNSTPTPGLKSAVLEYLLENAGALLAEHKTDHALAILEELTQRDRDFRSAEVAEKLSQAADTLISQEVDRGDFAQARAVMTRLDARYGAGRIATLATWRQRFTDQATDLKRQAEQKIADGAMREAEQLSRRMEAIWPDLPGGRTLRQEIVRRYPMVIVGVAEIAGRQDAASIDSWSARRTGRLTQRTLLEFNGAGPEGGQYLCAFGNYIQSDDRRRLTLELNSAALTSAGTVLDGYRVARRVADLADPGSPAYQPAWAALAERVSVSDVFKVSIDLRRPHVLPEAMLQIRLDATSPELSAPSPSDGPFALVGSDDRDLHFVANPRYQFAYDNHPSEIVERYFETSEEAVGSLRRGDIDVVDFLFPDDAARLVGDATLRVVPYALPTIHVLVPNHQKLFTANQTFRRALVYGINRQAILETEVLGNQKVAGCQLISGPFPVGTRDNDPLAYAYDQRIVPRSYYPRLASILNTLARRELKEKARKRGEDVPPETRIVLGYPGNQLARVTCQAISQYLAVVGITCELRELPPGADADATREMDLVYRQVAMWEPVVDARRLLAPTGVAEVGNEYVGMALRRLDAAKNWREARDRLHDLHRIVDDQVAIIPLWQTVNYLVYSQRVSGIGPRPLTLYQDVEQWQVAQPRGQE
jgi:hypothetical protein